MRAYKSIAQVQRKAQRSKRRTGRIAETLPEETVFVGAWGLLEDENGNLIAYNTNDGRKIVIG